MGVSLRRQNGPFFFFLRTFQSSSQTASRKDKRILRGIWRDEILTSLPYKKDSSLQIPLLSVCYQQKHGFLSWKEMLWILAPELVLFKMVKWSDSPSCCVFCPPLFFFSNTILTRRRSRRSRFIRRNPHVALFLLQGKVSGSRPSPPPTPSPPPVF